MPTATLSVVCLLLAQTGPGIEFEPQPRAPHLRGAEKAPALRLSEPGLGKPRSPEPKTIIQPSTRRPPVALEREEPEEATEFQPPVTLKPKARPAAPLTLEPAEDEPDESPPPRRPALARSKTPVTHNETSTVLASKLLRNALHNPEGLALPGSTTTLHAMLERTPDRAAQLKVVKSYWLLASGVAEHHYAQSEAEFLESLPAPRAAHEQAVLHAARASATAHLRQAELAATATQHDLAEAAQLSGKAALPLPADMPFVGAYRTSFKELFANRTAPAALKRIDRTLPRLRELIDSQAAAVSAADKSLYALSQAYEEGEIEMTMVVEALKQLRRQRREFLVAVRDYNLSIAEYALAVVTPSTSRSAVVAMLIEAAPSKTKSVLVTPKSGILPASGEEEFAPEERSAIRLTPDFNQPAFRAPASRDLVPVPPPSLNPSEFAPQSRLFR